MATLLNPPEIRSQQRCLWGHTETCPEIAPHANHTFPELRVGGRTRANDAVVTYPCLRKLQYSKESQGIEEPSLCAHHKWAGVTTLTESSLDPSDRDAHMKDKGTERHQSHRGDQKPHRSEG